MNLSNSDRTLLYGVLGFIAYQLWQQKNCACGERASGCAPLSSNDTSVSGTAPVWIRQLSAARSGTDYFLPRCGMFGRCA